MSPKERYLENSIRQLLAYKKVQKLIDGGGLDARTLLKLTEELRVDVADPLWGAINSGDHKTANLLCGPTVSLIEEKMGELVGGEKWTRETQIEYFRNLRNSN